MIRECVTTGELADLVRKQIGDKSAPVVVYRGAHPSQWSVEALSESDVSAPAERSARIEKIAQSLREQYDLLPR